MRINHEIFEIKSYDDEKNIAEYRVLPEWKDFVENYKIDGKNAFTLSVMDNKTGNDGDTRSAVYAYDDDSLFDDSEALIQFAKDALKYAEDHTSSITGTPQTADGNGKTVFTVDSLGYYLVDSTLGTLCHLTNVKPNATINEKNTSQPESDKKIVVDENEEETTSVKIGDTVEFKLTIENADNLSNVKATDKMDKGLTLTGSITAVQGNNTLEKGVNFDYKISSNEEGQTIINFTFKDELFVGDAEDIVITYKATLNENAKIEQNGNENSFKVTYGTNHDLTESTVSVFTYEMTLQKVDTEGHDLTGAIFQLSKDGELLNVVKTEKGYRLANGNEEGMTTSIVAGTVKISGLMNGTYSLEEIEAPEGYNKLGAPVEFTIEDGNYEGNFQVVNTTGMILPSTGGMGTVLFITVGSIMALGFGVNLVTKARMRKIED